MNIVAIKNTYGATEYINIDKIEHIINLTIYLASGQKVCVSNEVAKNSAELLAYIKNAPKLTIQE